MSMSTWQLPLLILSVAAVTSRIRAEIRRRTIERQALPRNEKAVRLYGELLKEYYGERAKDVRYAEAFELCEYGRRVSRQQLRELFPIQ